MSHSKSSNDGARLPRSLYAETAREPAATTDLEGDKSVKVAVGGGGLTKHLVRHERSVDGVGA